ncbi:MAG: hypothetical protein ISS91_02005 [Candidatus Omnitrophica bacterium]|nr:hypothetical protein [Candidatus Omnitrophota bacterium]
MVNTRFLKHIFCIIACGAMALIYVHQEVEIVKTSYAINEHRRSLSFLLDQHRGLVYNLSRLGAPKRIEDNLKLNEVVLCMPTKDNVLHLDPGESVYRQNDRATKPSSHLAKVLDTFTAKAEAKVAY